MNYGEPPARPIPQHCSSPLLLRHSFLITLAMDLMIHHSRTTVDVTADVSVDVAVDSLVDIMGDAIAHAMVDNGC